MLQPKRTCRIATILIVAGGVLPASASADASTTNACKNNITANNSQIDASLGATTPASVAPGAAITLTALHGDATVPGSIAVAGYNLGLLMEGENTIPAKVFTKIEGTNTVEGVQNTSLEDVVVTTTINDPDNAPGTGDETATDGTFHVEYDDLTFTAGVTGPAEFRQDTQYPLAASPEFAEKGSVIIRALIQGVFKVRFACSPGTVTPPDPGLVTPIDPANTFASTTIASPIPSCFGVDGLTLTPVVTPDGVAYVSAGVSTAPAPGAKAGENPFTGTAGPDVIIGTAGKDYVVGLGGNDKICTLADNDRDNGRTGNDQVDGGANNDGLWGQPGDDTLLGGSGNDNLTGQKGNDSLDGGADTDKCNGGVDTDSGSSCETQSNIP